MEQENQRRLISIPGPSLGNLSRAGRFSCSFGTLIQKTLFLEERRKERSKKIKSVCKKITFAVMVIVNLQMMIWPVVQQFLSNGPKEEKRVSTETIEFPNSFVVSKNSAFDIKKALENSRAK